MQLYGCKKQRILMNAFTISQFFYCSLVWMFHSRTQKNRINKIHERAFITAYKYQTFLSFDDSFKRDKSVSIHQKNLQIFLQRSIRKKWFRTRNYERYSPLYTKTINYVKSYGFTSENQHTIAQLKDFTEKNKVSFTKFVPHWVHQNHWSWYSWLVYHCGQKRRDFHQNCYQK